MRRLVFALGFVCAGAAGAQTIDSPTSESFAWQWSLPLAPGQSAARFELTPAVYARLTRDDLADLIAFNGAGQSMPLGPARHAYPRFEPKPLPAPVALPLFRLPGSVAAGSGEDLRLLIERGPDGRLRRLQADVAAVDPPGQGGDWLLDLDGLRAPVAGLLLTLDPTAAGTVDARVELAGSRDLAQWQTIDRPFAVVSLQQGDFRLERLRLGFAALEWPYLRLRRVDSSQALPLAGVRAELLPRLELPEQRLSLTLTGAPAADAVGVFEYRLDGPYPIERVAVELAERNSVADVVVESRAEGSTLWRERAQGTAFRIGDGGNGIGAGAFELPLSRDRHWRLRSRPALANAPALRLGYRAEPFMVLAQGEGPYVLAAGSSRASRPDYPLQAVFAGLAAQYGSDWLPPELRLDAGRPLAGDAALAAPAAPRPWGQYLLWAVLVAASVLIAAMAMRLVRERPRD